MARAWGSQTEPDRGTGSARFGVGGLNSGGVMRSLIGKVTADGEERRE